MVQGLEIMICSGKRGFGGETFDLGFGNSFSTGFGGLKF